MKTRTTLLALAFLVTFASAGPLDRIKRGLEKTFSQVTRALQHKDIKGFMAAMASDYTATDPTGKVSTRAEVEQSFTSLMNSLHDISWKRTVKKITKKGTIYETTTDGHMVAKSTGPDKKDHTLVFDATSVDEWEQIEGQWQVHSSKLLKVNSTMDGKPTPMH